MTEQATPSENHGKKELIKNIDGKYTEEQIGLFLNFDSILNDKHDRIQDILKDALKMAEHAIETINKSTDDTKDSEPVCVDIEMDNLADKIKAIGYALENATEHHHFDLVCLNGFGHILTGFSKELRGFIEVIYD